MKTYLKIYVAVLVLAVSMGVHAQTVQRLSQENNQPSVTAWESWSPYPEISPVFERDVTNGSETLVMKAGDKRVMGQWRSGAFPAKPGFCRFEIDVAAEGIASLNTSVVVMLLFMTGNGQWLQREMIDEISGEGEWRTLAQTVEAPEGAEKASVALMLRNTTGTVKFKNAKIFNVEPLPERPVTIASAFVRFGRTLEEDEKLMCGAIDKAASAGVDIVCLSETVYGSNTGLPLHKTAVKIPGMLTDRLGERARAGNIYVVVSLYEEVDGYFYNTAILIGRNGQVEGKFRKVYLPISEWEDGVMPGNDYPVFETDFGKIGMLVCWDQMFPEASEALRKAGAEIIFLPTAGATDIQAAARAADNTVYFVMSHRRMVQETKIYSPTGELIARATDETGGLAIAKVDLNKRFYHYWYSVGPCLGEQRNVLGIDK